MTAPRSRPPGPPPRPRPGPPPPRSAPALIDEPTASVLTPPHVAYLGARAVSLELAVAAGLHSVDAAGAARALGRSNAPSGGIAIPYLDATGVRVSTRIRMDAGEAKFLTPTGSVRPWFAPAPALEMVGLPVDAYATATTVVFVEGPIKALALVGAGILAVGLGGVTAGAHDVEARRSSHELRPHPDLVARCGLASLGLVVLFDAGIATNPNVAFGAVLAAGAVEAAGARAQIAWVPPAPDGSDRGPDDLLAKEGADAVRRAIASAAPATAPARLAHALRGAATADARQAIGRSLLADLVFQAALYAMPSDAMDRLATTLKAETGLPKKSLDEARAAFAERLGRKAGASEDDDTRPEIRVGSDIHRVENQVATALAGHPRLFQHEGRLVELVLAPLGFNEVSEKRLPHLVAETVRLRGAKQKLVQPPPLLVRGLLARPSWEQMRPLAAVVSRPIILPSGAVVTTSGYCQDVATWVQLDGEPWAIRTDLSAAEAHEAASRILEVVSDTQFLEPVDQAGWLSVVLTVLGRGAYLGCTPAFVVTSPIPGDGKTTIARAAFWASGSPHMLHTFPDRVRWGSADSHLEVNEEELTKILVALVRSPRAGVVFDNLRVLGGAALASAITGGEAGGRVLGRSELASGAFSTIVVASGINVALAAEFHRRVVPIRLAARDRAFADADFDQNVKARQRELTTIGLSLLASFMAARPPELLPHAPSFTGWSRLVRGCVAWATGLDPWRPTGDVWFDPDAEELDELVAAIRDVVGNEPSTAKQIVSGCMANEEAKSVIARVGGRGDAPDAATLARHLNRIAGRPTPSGTIARVRKYNTGVRWQVEPAAGEPSRGSPPKPPPRGPSRDTDRGTP